MSIKILLADDHKIVLDGLSSLLSNYPDMKVVAQAENGRKAVQLTRELQPDVVIMDIAMAELNGIDAARQIVNESPGVKVVFLSMHSDRSFVIRALRAGASGYLLKGCAGEELVFAIRTVLTNKVYLSPSITGILVDEYLHRSSVEDSLESSPLTIREREVLQLLAEGKTTKEIASCLNLSIKTIETYRKQIMEKLDLHNLAELTKYALRQGLISL
jgi:DNA-binding NarL/FixJ family response regulator